jgi:hypothetical protein
MSASYRYPTLIGSPISPINRVWLVRREYLNAGDHRQFGWQVDPSTVNHHHTDETRTQAQSDVYAAYSAHILAEGPVAGREYRVALYLADETQRLVHVVSRPVIL